MTWMRLIERVRVRRTARDPARQPVRTDPGPRRAATAAPTPGSRSTDLRPLAWYELSAWLCPAPECGLPAASGTHHWDDRGPYQQLSNHALRCPAGHRWTNSTDGG
ncbi:hypothetical protein [Streptomyces sp. NPDC051662]|uniref:hypothetical protein n=1 Tax=Streptomyces sp. NPDC051662 TaxID=3154750 RepID=UPI00342B3533